MAGELLAPILDEDVSRPGHDSRPFDVSRESRPETTQPSVVPRAGSDSDRRTRFRAELDGQQAALPLPRMWLYAYRT